MAGQDPSPQTTLLVLLGASSWPLSELTGSTAFEHAARDLHAYFLFDPNGFHLPQSNVLDLFNSDDSNTDILNRISDFLSACIARGEKSSAGVRDVFVYYIGHGGITTDSSTFYLAIRRTRKDYEKATSLAIDDLAERLKKGARSQRRILILDCCFAARAIRFLQGSAPAALVREKTVAAFKEIDQGVGIPSRGTSFLASSGRDVASVILPDETSTMFTSALLSALRTGDPFQERERLTLYTAYRLTADFLRRTHRDSFPQPELHSPDQSEGDIATTIALFPNPRAEEIRARRAEEERSRLAEEAEQTRRMEEEKQWRIEEERARQAEEERVRKAREEEQARKAEEERRHRVEEAAQPRKTEAEGQSQASLPPMQLAAPASQAASPPSKVSRHYWWVLALRGLLAVLFGLAALLLPGLSLLGLVYLFVAYAFMNGVMAVIVSLQERRVSTRWWVLLLNGLVGIIVGALVFVWPSLTVLGVRYLIASWAIVTGLFEITAAFVGRLPVAYEWTLALAGILSVLFGVILAILPALNILPAVELLSWLWLIGLYAIVFGVLLIIHAFQFRTAGTA